MRPNRSEAPAHWPVHICVLLMVLITVYPILWVVTIAFSGGQSLAITNVPANATFGERLRAIVPWPAHVSATNFVSLFRDQPFARWLLNSVVVAGMPTILRAAPASPAR